MNKKPLIDKVLHNWPVKLICIIIAIFLYIFHQASLINKKTLVVPLNIVENGIVMHVGKVPSSVSVVVRTTSADINSIHPTDITASVSLDEITEKGIHKVPVELTIAENLYSIDPLEIKLKDEYVNIDVDRKAVKYVKLQPSVLGEIAHGFKVSEIQVNPSSIEVYGPETVLNAIDHLDTTKINISNAETTFTTESYYLPVTNIYTVENKGPYRITVVVDPLQQEAEFVDMDIEIINAPENMELTSVLPRVSVKLIGAMKSLEEYIPSVHFAQLNMASVTAEGEYELPVKFNVPSKYEMINKSLSSVVVTVRNKIVEVQEELNIEETDSEKSEEVQ